MRVVGNVQVWVHARGLIIWVNIEGHWEQGSANVESIITRAVCMTLNWQIDKTNIEINIVVNSSTYGCMYVYVYIV